MIWCPERAGGELGEAFSYCLIFFLLLNAFWVSVSFFRGGSVVFDL